MEKHGPLFWIAQALSAVSILVFVFSWSKKEREKTLKVQMLGNILNISSYLCLLAYAGVFTSSVTLARNFIYRFKDKKKWIASRWLMYVFMAVLVVGTLYTWKGPMTIFPCVACLLGTYAVSCENTVEMKSYMFVACLLWIPYNIWVSQYMGALGSFILSVSIWIFLQREKEKNKKSIELL